MQPGLRAAEYGIELHSAQFAGLIAPYKTDPRQ